MRGTKYYKSKNKKGTCKYVSGSGTCEHPRVCKDARKCEYAIRPKGKSSIICYIEL